jgi:hypothetical protein
MWGQLRGNLEAIGSQVASTAAAASGASPGQRVGVNVSGLLSRVADVVAPPLDDDDDGEYYSDEDGEYFDEDEEDDYDDEGTEEEEEFVYDNNKERGDTEDQVEEENTNPIDSTSVSSTPLDDKKNDKDATSAAQEIPPKKLFMASNNYHENGPSQAHDSSILEQNIGAAMLSSIDLDQENGNGNETNPSADDGRLHPSIIEPMTMTESSASSAVVGRSGSSMAAEFAQVEPLPGRIDNHKLYGTHRQDTIRAISDAPPVRQGNLIVPPAPVHDSSQSIPGDALVMTNDDEIHTVEPFISEMNTRSVGKDHQPKTDISNEDTNEDEVMNQSTLTASSDDHDPLQNMRTAQVFDGIKVNTASPLAKIQTTTEESTVVSSQQVDATRNKDVPDPTPTAGAATAHLMKKEEAVEATPSTTKWKDTNSNNNDQDLTDLNEFLQNSPVKKDLSHLQGFLRSTSQGSNSKKNEESSAPMKQTTKGNDHHVHVDQHQPERIHIDGSKALGDVAVELHINVPPKHKKEEGASIPAITSQEEEVPPVASTEEVDDNNSAKDELIEIERPAGVHMPAPTISQQEQVVKVVPGADQEVLPTPAPVANVEQQLGASSAIAKDIDVGVEQQLGASSAIAKDIDAGKNNEYTERLEMELAQMKQDLYASQQEVDERSKDLNNALSQTKETVSSLQQKLSHVSNESQLQQQHSKEREQQMDFQLKEYSQECQILRQEKETLQIAAYDQETSEQLLVKKQAQKQKLLLEEHARTQKQAQYQHAQQLDQQASEMQQLQKVIQNMKSTLKAMTDRATQAEKMVQDLSVERDELEKEIHEELDHKDEMEEEMNELKTAAARIGSLEVS